MSTAPKLSQFSEYKDPEAAHDKALVDWHQGVQEGIKGAIIGLVVASVFQTIILFVFACILLSYVKKGWFQ